MIMFKLKGMVVVMAMLAVAAMSGTASAQVVWSGIYGAAFWDVTEEAASIQQTTDGGYIVAGRINFFSAGTDTDVWVLKLNGKGRVQWQKMYGGAGLDEAASIQQTSDGGYIVAGRTSSFSAGDDDAWILKLDAAGTVQWQKAYGGAGWERAESIQQTSDGGYIVAGYTTSFGAGGEDVWVLKLDAGGTVAWQKTYGGAGFDWASSIQQTSDGGYIVAGTATSFGAGFSDVWILKLNSIGGVQWQKAYGGARFDWANSIRQTSDGGYIVAGVASSFSRGSDDDAWILKLDAAGTVQWQKTYGGANWDWAESIQQTSDGGYIVAGKTGSFGTPFTHDAWVLKLDDIGRVQWQKAYGGAGWDQDEAASIQQTSDGGYIVAGWTTLGVGFSRDVWILKLDEKGNGCTARPSVARVAKTEVRGVETNVSGIDTGVSGRLTGVTETIPQVSASLVCN